VRTLTFRAPSGEGDQGGAGVSVIRGRSMSPSSLSGTVEIDGAEAWERSLAEPHAVWDGNPAAPEFGASLTGRLQAGSVVPHVVPKFALRADDVFFCIGSCFARVIEYQLLYRSIAVSSLAITGEPAEVPYAANGIVS
jgi:hypothetical protein